MVVSSFSKCQNPLKVLLKHRFLSQWIWCGPENLHFKQFPRAMLVQLVPDNSSRIIVLEYGKQHWLLLFSVPLWWKNLRLSQHREGAAIV